MYLALGIVFFILSVILLGLIVFIVVRSMKRGGELVSKKNIILLVPTFLIVFFLHVIASAFNGDGFEFLYYFNMVNTALELFKFKASVELLAPICQAYPIYYADFALIFIISEITVVLSVASIFSRRINNYIFVKSSLRSSCDIVVGDSKDAIDYVKRTDNSMILGDGLSNQRYLDLIKQGVRVMRASLDVNTLSKKLNKSCHNIIVFRDGKYSYTKIIETFMQLPNEKGVKIYLEANQQEMKILKEKFVTKADDNLRVYITGFSKYELMARRFVVDHPITKYIPRSFYNDNFTLKSDKQINVVFVGFGKVNYQLFRMCAMQFQFAQQINGKLAAKPVQYHIFDNQNTTLNNEFFSRILYEFDEDFKDCDFPKPEKICDLNVSCADINSIEAKKKFKSLVTDDSFTYFVVSLDSDLEDASYAQTIRRLLPEDGNYKIFVRAKNNSGEKLHEFDDRTIYFGEEKKLYTHENIVNDELTELAMRINLLYNKASNPPDWLKKIYNDENKKSAENQNAELNTQLSKPENADYMLKKWAELAYIEKASNLYHALNLPFKLNLLGFEMIKKAENGIIGISEDEFNTVYKNSGRKTDYNDYSFFFDTQSSNVLAYIEHLRWNALYILYDYKQMRKEDIKIVEVCDDGKVKIDMPHKNPAKKLHACITTYYGLNKLIEYKYNKMYPDEVLNETKYKNNPKLQKFSTIYAYDYMDLDRLYSEITTMGYKLIRNDGEDISHSAKF